MKLNHGIALECIVFEHNPNMSRTRRSLSNHKSAGGQIFPVCIIRGCKLCKFNHSVEFHERLLAVFYSAGPRIPKVTNSKGKGSRWRQRAETIEVLNMSDELVAKPKQKRLLGFFRRHDEKGRTHPSFMNRHAIRELKTIIGRLFQAMLR